jgi:hypothetical protein
MRRRHWIAVFVILLVGLTAGLLFPAISRVREAAARSKCAGHFKQLALALHNYADAYGNSSFPAGTIPNADLSP